MDCVGLPLRDFAAAAAASQSTGVTMPVVRMMGIRTGSAAMTAKVVNHVTAPCLMRSIGPASAASSCALTVA